ncbi:MAG: hypothetical protein LC104_15040 [Bacteroidales bacterium]|nr:hypothetical protein [Bacteroidales bacterium]
MIKPLTLECEIHFKRKRDGRKVLKDGPAPNSPDTPGSIPRISRLMALALRCERLLHKGTVASYTDIGKLGHVTQARVSQIMNLLNLAPEIQEVLLFLPRVDRGRAPVVISELQLIASTPDWQQQRMMWESLKSEKGIDADSLAQYL